MAEHRLITSLMRPFFRKGEAASFTLPRALAEDSRILCIDTGDLTDFLFHIPLINAVRRHYPRCKLDFLLPEKHESLVVPCGIAKNFIIYKEKQLNPWRPSYSALLRQLGGHHYDMAIVMAMEPSPRLELAALASGASLRLGPSHEKSWPAINFEIRPPRDPDLYLGDRLATAAPFLGLLLEELSPRWPLPMDRLRHMAQQVHFHKPDPDQMLVGIDPGVAKSGHALALDNLQYFARQLATHLMCQVVPLGNPEQGDRLAEFEARLSDVPGGLPRETALDMVLLLAQCDLLIAGNTDFFHLAVSLGIPVIGLFTDAEPACWLPTGRRKVQVLKIKKGGKVEVETLLEAVERVTEGRTRTVTSVIPPERLSGEQEEGPDAPPESGQPSSADNPTGPGPGNPDTPARDA